MEIDKLLSLQATRGINYGISGASTISTFERVASDCRRVIEDSSDKYRNAPSDKKKSIIHDIILGYVMTNKPLVTGFMNSDNQPKLDSLIEALDQEITNYSILTSAMEDESIFEIRVNGREIKVEKNGVVQDLLTANGAIVRFSSVTQQEVIIKKLLGDVKLTPKDALVNGSTIEGYRIAAVHSSAMSPDPNYPTADRYHAFVLRKFKKDKMSLGDIVKKGTLSDNMARTLALCPAGGLTFWTVGPTASGKTTTNNAILQSVPATTRTVLIQNPSEIDLRFRDEGSDRVYNDVLHLEAREIENPTRSDPTVENMMDHTLRLSPTFVCFGELRADIEFKQAMKIMQAGHPTNTTFHSESAEGAVMRFLTAFLAVSANMPSHLALNIITTHVNIIVVQKIMRDGKRRIIQISEVVGIDPNNPEEPALNDLYKFEITGDPEYDGAGNVKKINGRHVRVGKLSEHTIDKLKLEGVATSRYDFLLSDCSEAEVETYTGKNIDKYGIKLAVE